MQLAQLLKKLRGKDYRTGPRLGSGEQRRTLLHEIAQFWDEWTDEGTVELAIAALEEADDKVRGYALLCARAAVTGEKTRAWVTPERRARITQALVRAIARYEERPKELFWADRYVELLGLTASGSDKQDENPRPRRDQHDDPGEAEQGPANQSAPAFQRAARRAALVKLLEPASRGAVGEMEHAVEQANYGPNGASRAR